jgi:heme/copper-type cytochrome/quinol oxidase subunit 1
MLYSVGLIAMFTIGGVTCRCASRHQQTDTYYIIAHSLRTFGGLVVVLVGGVHYWFLKLENDERDVRQNTF